MARRAVSGHWAARERYRRLAGKRRQTAQMLAKHRDAEAVLQERTHALQERIKELSGLYAVARSTQQTERAFDEMTREVLQSLVAAYQYPEVACARLELEGHSYRTENFRAPAWRHVAAIVVGGERAGTLEVGYLDARPPAAEGPFLVEERNLLEVVAGLIGKNVEERRAKAELAASEQRFREVVEAVPEILYRAALPSCTTAFISPSIEPLLGFTPEEWLAGQHWQRQIHADDRERVLREVQAVLHGSNNFFSCEYRMWHKDGRTLRWFYDSLRVERDNEGRATGVFGVMSDISERRRMEEQLRAQAEQLADADRRKDEFLAVLAHELRNPLAPIRNAVEVLRRQPEPVSPMQHWAEEVIARQVTQLTHLVDDLLDVARITSGRIQLRREPVLVGDIVAHAVEEVRPLIERRRQTLTVEVADDPLWLNADAGRLVQVLSNLLTNAAKYTPEGGRIQLRAERDDGEVELRVRDEGIGIAPELMPRIFDLFAVEGRSLPHGGGLGIGLSIVRRLVQMHGGRIEAESAGPGRGSVFTVHLPLAPAGVERWPAGSAAPVVSLRARRVLVVDDERDVADSLSLLLKAMGHEVSTAYSGNDAIKMACRLRPEVVLLDIGMPQMDGYEVARRLRREPELVHTKLVALTGWGKEADRQRTREAGFDEHLVKPADLGALNAVLEGAA